MAHSSLKSRIHEEAVTAYFWLLVAFVCFVCFVASVVVSPLIDSGASVFTVGSCFFVGVYCVNCAIQAGTKKHALEAVELKQFALVQDVFAIEEFMRRV